MTSNTISRAACLAEIASNPKSFFNCPDMHGGSGLRPSGRGSQLSVYQLSGRKSEVQRTEGRERRAENG